MDDIKDRQSSDRLWLVVRYLNSPKGYMVTEGDVIKMGRLKFRVKELKGADPNKRISNFNLQEFVHLKENTEESYSEDEDGMKFKLPCRICLSENYKEDNPLICPCNCDGTMKYIHLKCLQRALRSKVTSRSSENALSFSWKNMDCDLCKRPYPYKFILNGNTIELIEIPKPPEKYVILEGLCKDKNSNKWLHVVSLNSKNSIRFGRANDCELKMHDISVSRLHGNIKFVGENFYLEDKGSKFGTLIQVKRPIVIESNKELFLQAGRTLLCFMMKKPWSLIPTCFRSETSVYDLLSAPFKHGAMPIFPINTGIPLSVEDPDELMSKAGLGKNNVEYKNNDNLMFEYGQLGMNSSLEEDLDEVEPVQEVVVANLNEINSAEALVENESPLSPPYSPEPDSALSFPLQSP